ncbi:ABC transporter substrate-binding protein [Minwuia thermotolerans]|uniref:Branched-chain amino acid ABC transporter substrate-binding protein n=1 Tax=Minwuia thermotolerans TaxID=2056226 RepID=A0A2M9G0L8_9PROT|nr:ABC transporter substrate-binding protein [Minwuia thermotolerans]PJK29260.1 branched-chain amino acid ABC transporter substrate-binding protein [Minwuia thermotolerans]
MKLSTQSLIAAAALAVVAVGAAEARNAPGVTDDEIKIGNTNPYSGPAAAYGAIGKTIGACFDKVNAEGGINGRKINFISVDDGYSPPRTVEQTRKLVERENVALIFQGLGTPTNSAVHAYLNKKKVPQLFVATGATKWGQPKEFPWTMGWQPNYQSEGVVYARYILQNVENPKVAILYQNDDYGKDYVHGMEIGLGDKADEIIVARESYEVTDPTIESQVVNLANSGANVFYNVTTPKFAAQAITKVHELDWDPLQLLNSVSNSIGSVVSKAGFEKGQGMITAYYLKDPGNPSYQNDEDYKAWSTFMDEYYPDGDKTDAFTVFGWSVCNTMVQVLKQAGDDLSRENIMAQAASLKDYNAPMLLPGITINTGPNDFYPIEQWQLAKFEGKEWKLFGEVLAGAVGSGS